MSITRRGCLQAAAGAPMLAAWDVLPRQRARATVPRDPAVHAVHRLTFGPTPGLAAAIRAQGVEAWIDQQLQPDGLDDSALEDALAAG